jgi:hypothetical protein
MTVEQLEQNYGHHHRDFQLRGTTLNPSVDNCCSEHSDTSGQSGRAVLNVIVLTRLAGAPAPSHTSTTRSPAGCGSEELPQIGGEHACQEVISLRISLHTRLHANSLLTGKFARKEGEICSRLRYGTAFWRAHHAEQAAPGAKCQRDHTGDATRLPVPQTRACRDTKGASESGYRRRRCTRRIRSVS